MGFIEKYRQNTVMNDRFLKTREEIQAWLNSTGIKRYTIRDDLTVDVGGIVDISNRDLTTIPVQFGAVKGNFWCGHNQLTDLTGSPKECLYFYGHNNLLTTLKGSPRACHVLQCHDNRLTSLDGAPATCARIYCLGNPKLSDISAAPDFCDVFYDADVVSKNQAAAQLDGFTTVLSVISDGSRLRSKSGRKL